MDQGSDYLEHQRKSGEKIEEEWYDRGKRPKKAATKYRKGACTNCGAMTHKAKDCMERPRKVGAKYTGKDIMPDEDIKEIKTTWDSKRDRWNGYDPEDYKRVIEKYEKLEQEKAAEPVKKVEENDSDEDEEKGEVIRSVRSMEDKARYLTEMDEEHTTYNPKTRTLRKEGEGSVNEQGYYVRNLSGKAKEWDELRQLAEKYGEDINIEANPTAALLKLQELRSKDQKDKDSALSALQEKYGDQNAYSARPKEIEEIAPPPEPEVNIGPARPEGMSQYAEDVYPGNHKSVWGSYWNNHRWGYQCCKSHVKQSYCTALDDSSKRKLDQIN